MVAACSFGLHRHCSAVSRHLSCVPLRCAAPVCRISMIRALCESPIPLSLSATVQRIAANPTSHMLMHFAYGSDGILSQHNHSPLADRERDVGLSHSVLISEILHTDEDPLQLALSATTCPAKWLLHLTHALVCRTVRWHGCCRTTAIPMQYPSQSCCSTCNRKFR